MYGLALGGGPGVESVIKSLLADLDTTLALSGYPVLDSIRGKASVILMHERQISGAVL